MTALTAIDPATLRQIENAIFDLQSSDCNTFDKHIKKLSRVLHSSELEPVTSSLMSGIDLDVWIKEGLATQGSMVGSATLDWPSEPEKELGTVIRLIDRFAERGADDALSFAHDFYYNGNSINSNLHSLTRQVFIPFARDYIDYVKAKTGTIEAAMLPVKSGPAARKVFIVHGHDEAAREMVARYVQKLGFEPIILHEQASRGRTVIEKIDDHSDVGFAVVVLTPDDVGARKGEESKLQNRARQNVLIELGYFLGKLGRSRVSALKRGNIEVPSDFEGVVYVPFDEAGGWKNELGRELQAAGFEIDWNTVMRL
ncbi:MAG TPA: nucleotide-binding protein [Xanthobacteraceae bacterium]|nr:nucleotide-binding protein [Xanthobacteraceae bacterium]